MADLLHHSDDLHLAIVHRQVRSHRLDSRQVLADERAVGHRHLASLGVVCVREGAAREQRNPQRRDPAWRRPARLRRGRVGGRERRASDDGEVRPHVQRAERQHVTDRRSARIGQSGDP